MSPAAHLLNLVTNMCLRLNWIAYIRNNTVISLCILHCLLPDTKYPRGFAVSATLLTVWIHIPNAQGLNRLNIIFQGEIALYKVCRQANSDTSRLLLRSHSVDINTATLPLLLPRNPSNQLNSLISKANTRAVMAKHSKHAPIADSAGALSSKIASSREPASSKVPTSSAILPPPAKSEPEESSENGSETDKQQPSSSEDGSDTATVTGAGASAEAGNKKEVGHKKAG